MADAKTLGARLRAARKRADLSQSDLARYLGTRTMTISTYERDQVVPRADFVVEASKVLQVDPAWLLTGEGEGPAEAA